MTVRSAAVALLFAFGAAGAADAADIVVLHGASAETVSTTDARGVPAVMRGKGETLAQEMIKARRARREAPPRTYVVAGETLWIVDRNGRPLQACKLARTEYFARSGTGRAYRRIECSGR